MISMLVEAAIANISDPGLKLEAAKIDWLDLTWLECQRRFARKRTRDGAEVRLLLRLRQTLKHGDVLGHWPNGRALVVNLLPAEVLIIRPRNHHEWITAAFQLGNLHVPIEENDDCLIVPNSGEVETMLAEFNLEFRPQQQRFSPTLWPRSVNISSDFRIIRRGDVAPENIAAHL